MKIGKLNPDFACTVPPPDDLTEGAMFRIIKKSLATGVVTDQYPYGEGVTKAGEPGGAIEKAKPFRRSPHDSRGGYRVVQRLLRWK